MPLAMHSTPNLAIFDVCDTLYSENTTRGFIRYVLEGRKRLLFFDTVFSNHASPLFWPLAALHRLTGIDIPRHAIVSALRGFEKDRLKDAARTYADMLLPLRVVEPIHRRLGEHQAAGDRVVLVSSSLDIIVEAIAEKLGTEWRASGLKFHGAVCAGRLASDLTGRKLSIVRRILDEGENKPRLVVYTDNYSDMELLKAADCPVVVVRRRGRRGAWDGLDAEFVMVE